MVGVAQLVERWIVIPVVVGSIPIVHPIFQKGRLDREIGRLFVLALCACLECLSASQALKMSWRTPSRPIHIRPLAIL